MTGPPGAVEELVTVTKVVLDGTKDVDAGVDVSAGGIGKVPFHSTQYS